MVSRVTVALISSGVLAAVVGCGDAQCAAACWSSNHVRFDPPIGAPGRYTVSVGSLKASFEIPTVAPASGWPHGFVFRDFALAEARMQERARAIIAVQVERDGDVVLSRALEADSVSHSSICGMECSQASFTLAVPDELVAPPRGPCDLSMVEGTYTLTESPLYGGCSDLFAAELLTLSAGAPQSHDEGCTGTLLESSAEECTSRSRLDCQGPSLDATWELSLTDFFGDGTTLLGSGILDMRAPIACQGHAALELRR